MSSGPDPSNRTPLPPLAGPKGDRVETYLQYYLLQYQRAAAHETNRLQMSSIVTAGSVVALGLVTSHRHDFAWISDLLAVVFANLFAAAFSYNSRLWVKVHQARADMVLTALAPDLAAHQEEINQANGVAAKWSQRNRRLNSARLIVALHAVITIVACSALVSAL